MLFRSVHVEDRWFGVQSDCVELVRILHCNLCKCVEITSFDGLGDEPHALWYDVFDAMLEEGRSFDSPLHSRGGGGSLLVVRDDTDEGVHLGPMFSRCDLDSEGIRTIRGRSHFPCHETTEEGSTGRSRSLASDQRKLRWGGRELVERREGFHQGCKTGRRGSQSSSSREIVFGCDVDVELGKLKVV